VAPEERPFVGPRRTEAVTGLLAAVVGSVTVALLAYGPVEGGGLVMATSIQGGVTRHAVLTLTERHGLASGGWSSAPMVVMLCVPFLLIGGAALVDALRDQLWARVALVGLAGLVATVTVVGIASIGLLLAPTTLLAAASAATASTRRR
jgi:hypothetical protein